MSYILEALKKSDRERKQGKIPDLGTVQDPHFRDRRRRRIRPFFLFGLLAISAALWGAWLLWRGEEPASRTTVATTASEEAPGMAPVPVAEPAVPPLVAAGDQPDSNSDQNLDAVTPAPAEAPQAAEPATLPTAAPEPPPLAEEAMEIAPADAMEEQLPPPEDHTETRVVKLENLPADLKAELPEIKIGVHLYRDDPNGRRASINGRLFREGQSVEPGLHLEEITRQGAILSFRGRRFSVAVFPR